MSNSLQPHDCSLPGSLVHGTFPGKNTEVGCHFLLQRISPTQGLHPSHLHLLHWHWQAGSLPLAPQPQLCLSLYLSTLLLLECFLKINNLFIVLTVMMWICGAEEYVSGTKCFKCDVDFLFLLFGAWIYINVWLVYCIGSLSVQFALLWML